MYSTNNGKHIPGRDVRLFSKKEAAAAFEVCYRTIERWLSAGYIESIRIGGRVYICYSEIYRIKDQFLEEKPNGSRLESYLRTVEDIYRRYEQRPHTNLGARR